MIYYTKNGSIPYPITDGTEGWTEAPAPPECPEGKEVIWVAPQWIIRDPKPADRLGYRWAYYLDRGWVEISIPVTSLDTAQSHWNTMLNLLNNKPGN